MYKKVLAILAIVLTMVMFYGMKAQATIAEIVLETEENQKVYDGRAVYDDKVRFAVKTKRMDDSSFLEVTLKNHQGMVVKTYTADSDIWILADNYRMVAELKDLKDGYYTLTAMVGDKAENITAQSTVGFIKDSMKPKITVENNLTFNEERTGENYYTGGSLVVSVEEMTLSTEADAIIAGNDNVTEEWNTAIDAETGLVTKTVTLDFGEDKIYKEGSYSFKINAKDVLERKNTYITNEFYIDYTPPMLDGVTYDTEALFHTVGTKDYVNAPTTMTFTIIERNPTNNKSFITSNHEEKDCIWIEKEKNVYSTELLIPMLGEKGDEQTITLEILDKAGNLAKLGEETVLRSAENTAFESGVFTDKFTVDTVAPVIRLEHEKLEPNRFNIDGIDYFNQPVTVKVTIDEHNVDGEFFELSIKTIDKDMIYEESEWTGSDDIYVKTVTFDKDHLYELSISGTDIAKNPLKIQAVDKVTAISEANGNVVLKTAVDQIFPWIEFAAKTVAKSTTIDGQPLYNEDVLYKVVTGDPLKNNYASGIYNTEFLIKGEDGTELIYDAGSLLTSDVKIASKTFNTNGIVLSVNTEDVSSNKKEISAKPIAIDMTAPKAEVSYDNNNVNNDQYFNTERTATITVTERNFSDDCFQFLVNGEDQKLKFQLAKAGSGNRDNAVWTASYTFDSDGDYQIECRIKDRANNQGTVSYNGVAPQEFTVDMTNPMIRIEFDNHNVSNESYYAAQRIATIIVTEHNFDSSGVVIIGDATDAGAESIYPSLSDWSSNGDEHRATLIFSQDALYTLDAEYEDLAANRANDIPEERFTVDTTDPELVVSGVENETPYPDEVRPKIYFSDNNYDRYEVKLIRTEREKIGVDVTEEIIGIIDVSIDATGKGTGVKLLEDIECIQQNDGIYTLLVTVYDKAGRRTEKSVTYSVNRFGSVYVYSKDLAAMLNGYHKMVTGDLYIDVYNADQLMEESTKLEITCDGATLIEQKSQANVKKALQLNTGGWFQYKFRLNAADFANDGRYRITLSDKDEAGNIRTNSEEPIEFYVDTTAPMLENVIGLEEAIVNADKQTISYTISDEIALASIKVYVNDQMISEVKEFEDLTTYNGAFTIAAGIKQKVRIMAEDIAGNVLDTSDVSFETAYTFHDEITVSRNFWIRWYANKSFFWGSIAAIASGIVIGGIFLSARKMKENASS